MSWLALRDWCFDALASATDSALGFLSGRIECHTAQGGVIDAQLTALRSQARTRRVRWRYSNAPWPATSSPRTSNGVPLPSAKTAR